MSDRAEHNSTPGQDSLASLTLRAAFLAVALTFAIYLLTTKPGFVRINWVPYTSPPVQPFFILLLFMGYNSLAGRWRKAPSWLRPFTRAELFFIYAALCISMPMERGGYVIHYLTSGKYFATDANKWEEIFTAYPDWFVPKDEGVIRRWMEGSATMRIPWDAWRGPMGAWFAFQMTMIFTVTCLVSLFRKQWSEGERLTHPLLFLPLEITGGTRASGLTAGFFKSPLMWIGFGIAAAFNGINILHAYVPAVKGIERYLTLDPFLQEGWLRHVQPLGISFALEVCGLAYLVSGEVLLSSWLLYFAMKAAKVLGLGFGYRAAGFPFPQEMSAGGSIALVIFLVWIARPYLREVWGQLWGQTASSPPGPLPGAKSPVANVRAASVANEPMPAHFLLLGVLLGSAGMVWFWAQAGLNPALMIVFLVSMFVFVIVAARVRAEAGPPVVWCHPYGFDQTMPLQILGSRFIKGLGDPRQLPLFGVLFWIGRAAYPHQVAQYALDGYQLAQHGKVRRSHLFWLMLLACAVGLCLALWYHLDVGYKFGQVLIGSRSGEQVLGWGFQWSSGEYQVIRQAMTFPEGPDWTRIGFYGVGFACTSALTIARTRVTNFPLHPLGFLLATLYGDYTPYWFPFFFAWMWQRIFLRYGGLKLYRKFVPMFLGLAFGHILIGGFLWRIVINYFIDPSISKRYYLNLGG